MEAEGSTITTLNQQPPDKSSDTHGPQILAVSACSASLKRQYVDRLLIRTN